MPMLKARVRNGRLVLDEPTSLPEGSEIELHLVEDDGMSDDEHRRLHASITRGIADGRAGRETDLDNLIDELADDR
jgi:hypothetical protein